MWVIGHRGASGHAPENTMAAFRRAAECGATCIETDLHLSRDARFVAIHDDTLDRTTDGYGPVSDWSIDELRDLDAGMWYGREFAGQRIPTLEEVLEFACDAGVLCYLELKTALAPRALDSLLTSIADARAAACCVVISFDSAAIEAVRRRDFTLVTGLLFDSFLPDAVPRAERCGARMLLPRGDRLTPEILAGTRRAGLRVVPWTVNRTQDMECLAAAGVDGIITDFPDRLLSVLGTGVRQLRRYAAG